MTSPDTNHFDREAASWDDEPRRVALTKALGECILQDVRPTGAMDVLEYGCGTGLLSLFLLPHVQNVTAADSSAGMLEVLDQKIAENRLEGIRTLRLDLLRDPLPECRFDLIATAMTLHHVQDVDCVLRSFHALLRPGGTVCLADLDREPGTFHPPEVAHSVHHLGFDRAALKGQLAEAGFSGFRDTTVYTIEKSVDGSGTNTFPVFLLTGRREGEGE